MLHHSFRYTHRVYGISCLIGTQAHNSLHTSFNSSMEHIVRTFNICLHSLHWEKLTRRDLFEGSCMEDIIHTRHSISNRSRISYIPNIKLHFGSIVRVFCLEFMSHIILFLFISGKDTDLSNIGFEKML